MLVISLHTELVTLLSSVAPAIQNQGHWQLKIFTVLSGLKLDCLKVMAMLGKRGDVVLCVTSRQSLSVSPKEPTDLLIPLPQVQTLSSVRSCGGTMVCTTALWKHQEIPQVMQTKKLS